MYERLSVFERGAAMCVSRVSVLFLLIAFQVQAVYAERLFGTSFGHPLRGILEIDPATGGVLNAFDPPVAQGPGDGLAFDGSYLYYLSGTPADRDKLFVLNADTGEEVTMYTLPDIAFSMFGQGLTHLDGLIYILDWSAVNQDIVVFDPATGTVVDTIDFDAANPDAPMIGGALGTIRDPDALLVSTFDSSGPHKVLEIDPKTGSINHEFDHGLGYEEALGLASLGGNIYVADHTAPGVPFRDQILIFSRDGTRIGEITVPDALGLQSLAGGAEVPEPSSLVLAAVAFAGLGLLAWRRRK